MQSSVAQQEGSKRMNILLSVIDGSTRLSESTKEEYRRCVGRFVVFAGEDPAAWNGAVVEQWRDHLCANMGQTTVNKHLYALRYASKRLEGLGVGVDFARAAESLPASKNHRRKALTVEEVRALVETCDRKRPMDLRDLAIITVALRTGLRASNLVGLSWGRIKGRVAECVIKGNKVHEAILDDRCLSALQDWGNCLQGSGLTLRGLCTQANPRKT